MTDYGQKDASLHIVSPGSGGSGQIAGSDLSRIIPRQMSTGTLRGTQNVGYGQVKIDGSNNRITIGDTDGSSIGMGSVPTTISDTGFFALDTSGKLVWKQVGPTTYVYDPTHSYTNILQLGILPDGSGGLVTVKPGINVADVFA